MSATSIPVARLLQLGVPIAWQEAVELARTAHEVAATAGVPLVLDACVISIDGTVHLIPSPAGLPGHPLTLTGLLGMLLQGQDAPAELRALVDGGGAASGEVPDLDLSWFASPRPDLEIARLATRGIEAAATHDADAAIHRLRVGVTDAPPPPPPTRPGIDPRALLRALGLAAAVVLLLGGAALVVKQAMEPAPMTAEGDEAAPAATPSVLDSAFDSLNRFFAPSGGTAPAPAAPGAAESAAGAARVGKRPATASANRSGAAPSTKAGAAPASGGTAAGGRAGEVPVTMEHVEITASLPRIYSHQDADVEPPAFLHPQMPSEPNPDSRPSESHIEVTVDEQGLVMQVRLRSSDASVHERMLVAAAKAWQFRPALKDGQPVPYLLQVKVTR